MLNLLAHAFRCLVTVAHTVWKLIAARQLCPGPPSYRIWVYTISLKHLAGFKPVFLFSGELHLPVVYTCCYTSLPLIEVIMPVLRATRRTVQLVTTPPDVRPRQHDKLDNTLIYNQDEFDVKRVDPAEFFNSYICQLAWCFDYRCSP